MTKSIFRKIVLEVWLIIYFDSSPIHLHGEGGVYDLYCSQPPGGDQRARSFTFPDTWGTHGHHPITDNMYTIRVVKQEIDF